jgi:DHA1 family tetracycline resistance protein-like MFS transporter
MYRYGWDERTVGLALAGVGAAHIVAMGGTGLAVKRFGERRLLVAGLAFGMTGLAMFGLAPTGSLFWLGIPLTALWSVADPASQGLASRRIGPHQQGQLQGADMCLLGVANLLGPGLFTQTFAFAIGAAKDWGLPGAPYLLAAALLVLAIALALVATRDTSVSSLPLPLRRTLPWLGAKKPYARCRSRVLCRRPCVRQNSNRPSAQSPAGTSAIPLQ